MTAFLNIPPRGRNFEDGPADIGLLGPGLTSLLALAGPLATWPTVAGDICLAGSFAMWMRGLRNELLWVLACSCCCHC